MVAFYWGASAPTSYTTSVDANPPPLRCHRRTVSGWTTSRCWRPALWPEQANPDPKDSISISEARVRVGAQDDVKLMAKDEILETEVTTRP